jgi:hypothetical protein
MVTVNTAMFCGPTVEQDDGGGLAAIFWDEPTATLPPLCTPLTLIIVPGAYVGGCAKNNSTSEPPHEPVIPAPMIGEVVLDRLFKRTFPFALGFDGCGWSDPSNLRSKIPGQTHRERFRRVPGDQLVKEPGPLIQQK